MTWSKPHWKVGDICTHAPSGNWYVIKRVTERGACSGIHFYGPSADGRTKMQLRARTDRVQRSRVPVKVLKALAYFALTGEVLRG